MTMPLDKKGLEAIISAMRAEGIYLGTETAARFVRAYLSATSVPDGLLAELRARRAVNMAWPDEALIAIQAEINLCLKAATALSQAQSALAAMRVDRDSWQRVAHRAEQVATDNATQIKRLTEEKEALRERVDQWDAWAEGLTPAEISNGMAKQDARIKALEEALRPFAEYLDECPFDIDNKGNALPDDTGPGWTYLTAGDFRRARKAMESGE